ncbi:lipoprotein [Spiroplasma sp. ald]|uniref:lipoprotein n=1 Tax=Spiroplasma sp. ald TaxID=2490849 RepID=UPI0037DCCCFB
MRKILSILGTITLIGTSATSLVACNTPQYTQKELLNLKEKNNIKTKDGILEWIAPQEKPFNERVDNKWYFIIYKDNSNNTKISKKINNNPNTNVALPWSPNWIKVYRWDGNGEPNLPEIDKNGNIKI